MSSRPNVCFVVAKIFSTSAVFAMSPCTATARPPLEPRRAGAVSLILSAELFKQQSLFRSNTRKEDRDHEPREQHADARTKGKAPPQRADEESQIARVADDAINTIRYQRVPGLNGDEP